MVSRQAFQRVILGATNPLANPTNPVAYPDVKVFVGPQTERAQRTRDLHGDFGGIFSENFLKIGIM